MIRSLNYSLLALLCVSNVAYSMDDQQGKMPQRLRLSISAEELELATPIIPRKTRTIAQQTNGKRPSSPLVPSNAPLVTRSTIAGQTGERRSSSPLVPKFILDRAEESEPRRSLSAPITVTRMTTPEIEQPALVCAIDLLGKKPASAAQALSMIDYGPSQEQIEQLRAQQGARNARLHAAYMNRIEKRPMTAIPFRTETPIEPTARATSVPADFLELALRRHLLSPVNFEQELGDMADLEQAQRAQAERRAQRAAQLVKPVAAKGKARTPKN